MNDSPVKEFYSPGLMDLTDYRLERCDGDPGWNDFVEKSAEGTIFSRREFLDPLPERSGLWYCLKKNQIKAAVAVLETEDGKSCTWNGLMIYNGVMFAPPDVKQNRAQIQSDEFRTCCAIVRDLPRIYDGIRVALAPAFADIRPFLWHNYGGGGLQFTADVRYTSQLILPDADWPARPDDNPVYPGFSKSRRQEIRYGEKKGVTTREDNRPDLFARFYQAMFAEQGQEVTAEKLAQLDALIRSLHGAGMARMYVTDTAEGEPGSIAVFGLDSKRAYYIWGANNPALKQMHTGSCVIWDALRLLHGEGVRQIDFEGINSPRRGYFKLSVGGDISPYYRLTL